MLAYADNIVLLAKEEDMRVMIARLERYVREKRLEVNVGKQKIMRFRRGREERVRWRWEGRKVRRFGNIDIWGTYSSATGDRRNK